MISWTRIAAIIRREYLERVKTKAFWISTLLVPVFLGAVMIIPAWLASRGGGWLLTTAERKRILLAHIFGVDIDAQAVEVTMMSLYLKALEGERAKVTRLYARIFADPRHKDLEMLHCESIAERRYGEWSMARVSLSDVDPQTKIDWPEFDPYSANGQLVMAKIDDLIARGKLVSAPLSES